MDAVEAFFRDYSNTIAAIGSFGTLAAVIVSLWLAFWKRNALKPKIVVSAQISLIVDKGQSDIRPRYLTVHITNKGQVPVRIPFSFFFWKLPLLRGFWMVNPLDFYATDSWVPQKQYPFKLEPNHTESFFVSDIESFYESMERIVNDTCFLAPHFLQIHIVTDDGSVFKAKLPTNLRKEMICRKPPEDHSEG